MGYFMPVKITDVANDETIVHSSTDLSNFLAMLEQEVDVAARKAMLKYTPAMELELVRCILAHKNSTKGTSQVKYSAVVETLWKNPLFS